MLHGGVQPGLREGREGVGASRCPMALAEGAAVPYAVELGLTVLHTALYAALFLFAYLQLWLLLYYRERRLSYHTLCLFLCLLWAALRTTLFSFYLQNSLQALRLQQPFAHWLLYCLPGCLLFSSLCLLNLYFAEVSFAFWAKPLQNSLSQTSTLRDTGAGSSSPKLERPGAEALGWDGDVSAQVRLGGDPEGPILGDSLRGCGAVP